MSATATAPTLLKDLEAIVGAEHVLPGAPSGAPPKPGVGLGGGVQSAIDNRQSAISAGAPPKPGVGLSGDVQLPIDEPTPRAVVSPANPQQVAEVLKYARAHDLVVVPAGGFTGQGTGAVPPRVDILLLTTRLTAVEHYDAGDLTIGIGAGATVSEVERIVGEHNQLFPLDVAQPDRMTIGGALATNAHGPLKHGYGGLRDFCTGVRFVTTDGKIAKGGARVVKNVAGYDMMKLLIGSYGTLAVITSASFKVSPRPRQTGTFLAVFNTLAEIIAFRDRLLRSPLSFMAMELLSPHGAAYVGAAALGCPGRWALLLRAAGSDAVLARYRRELGSGTCELSEEIWAPITRLPHTIVEHSPNAMLVRVDAAIKDVAAAITAAERAATDNNFLCAPTGRVGVGALTMAFVPIAQPVATHYANAVSSFRASLPRDASAIVLHCPSEAKRRMSVWGTSPTDIEAMRAIKRAFDPEDILNRGRFLF